VSDADGEGAAARLSVLCRTHDGFEIAEEDLRLRGPGEQMGTRQHGMPAFRVYRPGVDDEVLRAARAEANRLLADDPALAKPPHRALRAELLAAHRERVGLLGVG
jgi:ATP-dependent DNA helicase RecG